MQKKTKKFEVIRFFVLNLVQNVSELTKINQYNDRFVRLILNEKSIERLKKIMTKNFYFDRAFELTSSLWFIIKLTNLQKQMTEESISWNSESYLSYLFIFDEKNLNSKSQHSSSASVNEMKIKLLVVVEASMNSYEVKNRNEYTFWLNNVYTLDTKKKWKNELKKDEYIFFVKTSSKKRQRRFWFWYVVINCFFLNDDQEESTYWINVFW